MNTKNLLVGIGLCLLSACTEVDNKLEVTKPMDVTELKQKLSEFVKDKH